MNVLPGKFQVEIDKQYIEDKKLYPLAAVEVTIKGDGDVLRGNDFSLARLSFQPAFLVSLGEFSSGNHEGLLAPALPFARQYIAAGILF
ncbi:hypothetical protein P4S64_05260 [Vibrio sp. M60_M31a]